MQRWEITLHDFNIDDLPLAVEIGEHYINESPLKVNLFRIPGRSYLISGTNIICI
ncbi:MAG: hypothetical protein U5Q03_07735 [Bacteroidota bacterium]|nr:hypothetical protein [Bacteroidota bacterium]